MNIKIEDKAEYTQGVSGDGAAILKNGQTMTIEEILSELRQLAAEHGYADPLVGFYKSENEELRKENERLRGIKPELPPRPPLGYGLPRYGVRWNGPTEPLAVLMDDGYWTPWHLANDRTIGWVEMVARADDLKSACRLGMDMIIANDLDIPVTLETIRDSINRSPQQSLEYMRRENIRNKDSA